MKNIRLDAEVYEQGACFSLTLATAGRKKVFHDERAVELCLEELNAAATGYSASVYAYCFMPDHLHLLATVPEGVSLLDFVRHFKQLTCYRFRSLPHCRDKTLWQRRFYDHALRKEEDINVVATYIWGNPVRAGLVSDLREYPYWGSLVWDRQTVSGSEDPDLQGRPTRGHQRNVGECLQTLAKLV
ncbi:MAG: transposase [Chloroflexi bacterium]|nr:transposase [Chloroflexota bacterium]